MFGIATKRTTAAAVVLCVGAPPTKMAAQRCIRTNLGSTGSVWTCPTPRRDPWGVGGVQTDSQPHSGDAYLTGGRPVRVAVALRGDRRSIQLTPNKA